MGLRKRDAVAYYEAVAPVILPHLRDRPFTIKRHYNGPRSPFEWVKDAPPELPGSVRRCPLPAKSRRGLSPCGSPSEPDYVLFDIDREPVRNALLVRQALDALGLESIVKTSGGDGLHVAVPIGTGHSYPETREFARIVAGAVGADVDTKLNGEGMTIASAYSLRPLPGAPVSTPLAWDEVEEGLDPPAFTAEVVLRRIEERGDLWAPVPAGKQRLADALARL